MTSSNRDSTNSDTPSATHLSHPFCAEWQGPSQGLPPFDQIKPEELEHLIGAALSAHRTEVTAIASNPDVPDFRNTLVALEQSGRALQRILVFYRVCTSTKSDSMIQELQSRIAPRLSEHFDAMYQDPDLFKRIRSVYEQRDAVKLNLKSEQKRLAWLFYQKCKEAGALLRREDKARLLDCNKRLSELSAQYAHNILKAEEEYTHLISQDAIAGVPEELLASMSASAAHKGLQGWVVSNTRSVVEPFLTYCRDRTSRQKVFELFVNRCDGGPHDNNRLITEIVSLRAERAELLGYSSHAALQLENTMARSEERVYEILNDVWRPAIRRINEELAGLRLLVHKDHPGSDLEPWDYRFYQEQVKSSTYAIDESMITPYLRVDRIRDGMFFVASELFSLSFTPLTHAEAPRVHEDDEVYTVSDRSGRVIGALYLNPFQHTGKRSGAWMDAYRVQENIDRFVPAIVCNECNNPKAPDGSPSLLSWDGARTLLHEFGHALHGLLSEVTYPSLSGTDVPRDLVELPSQLFENWLSTPRFLERFARHYQTDQPMPDDLIAKLEASSKHDAAFRTIEAVSCAIIDLTLHARREAQEFSAALFERQLREELSMPREICMRHRLPHFAHIFSGGYSAGYYSYLWADILAADAWQAFVEAPDGAWDRATAQRLRDTVLSVGNTVPADEAYRAFRGRDVNPEALMRARGFDYSIS
jgi:peptidyl-dipeptidase Dcp